MQAYLRFLLLICVAANAADAPATAASEPKRTLPIFDAHIHYNRAAWRPFDPRYVLELMRRAGVVGGLVGSWPNEGTVKLHDAFPKRFVPELCPYSAIRESHNWTKDPAVIPFLTKEVATGRYGGLGELHIYKQEAVDWAVVERVVRIAQTNNLFLHMHARADVIERLFKIVPDIRILWAHAGFYESYDPTWVMV